MKTLDQKARKVAEEEAPNRRREAFVRCQICGVATCLDFREGRQGVHGDCMNTTAIRNAHAAEKKRGRRIG